MKKSVGLLLSLAFCLCASAQVVSRAELQDNQRLTGYYVSDNLAKSGKGIPKYGENDHCKAGIELTSEMLSPYVGKKIAGIRFGLCADMDKSRVFVAGGSSGSIGGDIVSKDVVSPKKGWNSVMFDNPYVIVEGQDLLVGFEFAQKTKTKGGYYSDVCYPLSLVKEGLKNKPVLLFYRDGDEETWHNVGTTGDNLSIQVILEGDFSEHSVVPLDFGTVAAMPGKESAARVKVLNLGRSGVGRVSYTVSVDGVESEERGFAFDAPVASGAFGTIDVAVPAIDSYGRRNVAVRITRVGDYANGSAAVSSGGYVGIAEKFYPRNVLLEEFTTEKCSNCPRVAGYIHKVLKSADKNRVFAVCHHSAFGTDWLTQPCDEEIYSLMFGGDGNSFAPAVMVNRNGLLLSGNPSAQGNVFLPSSQAEISYYVGLAMEEKADSRLGIEVLPGGDGTQATIIVNGECNEEFEIDKSRLTLYVTEDSIAAKGQDGADEKFRHMHVIRYYNSSWGDRVVWNDNATFTATYNVDIDWNWEKKHLKCVAFLSKLNDDDYSDNRIDNSASADFLHSTTSVDGIADNRATVATARYNISGQRIPSAAKGVNILRLSDGRTVKVVVR